MSENNPLSQPARQTVLVGWAFSIAFAAHSILGVILPRLEKESALREAGRGWHYFVGLLLGALAIWLLRRWHRDGFAIPPGLLPPALRSWHRMIALVFPLVALLAIPLGFLNAWGEGRIVHLVGLVDLPTLMDQNRVVWQFSGYFHSALGILLVMVSLLGLVSAAYSLLRYRTGLLAAFPPGIGVFILTKATLYVYAVNSFRERKPGYIAAAILLALVGLVWLIGRRRTAAAERTYPVGKAGVVPTIAATIALAGAAAYAIFAPYLMFKVTPFASGVVVAGDPNVSWHIKRQPGFAISPETEFERTTAMETYKWCEFCHTVKAGAKPLVGPNLHNIFGQRAATVPNFYYSEAMASAGKAGLVWNDSTIADFIANTDEYVPGTTMHVSSGPVTDPKIREAVVNILKRRTMGDNAE